MLALLLARRGVPVVLLEEHRDFEREFRGDTLHPAAMENLNQIGLAVRLLRLRHTKVRTIGVQTGRGTLQVNLQAGFRFWRTKFPYITVIAQSRFLQFITEEAARYPNFNLIMGARVDELVFEDGTVRGVRYSGNRYHVGDGDWHEVRHEVRARLTIGADGRFSRVRKLAGLEPVRTSPPIDVLWFRLSRHEGDPIESLGARIGNRLFVLFIDRFDYWQMGCVIPKGGYRQLRARGLAPFREALARAVTAIADRVGELQEWKQISVLSVESNRLKRWYRPGLLLIGDAAHVMSPVGGVGINYAIRDAVVGSNVLGNKLKAGVTVDVADLARVQRRRELPTRVIQAFQTLAQRLVMARLTAAGKVAARGASGGVNGEGDSFTPPAVVRLLLRIPIVLALPARFIGWGLWPPRIRSVRHKKNVKHE
jgi:2-polyprenyl-6-methoxyphenol hydroxylase-like FAD-dependent oxidoreductase